MAYELGTHSQELLQEHEEGRHRGEPLEHLDCPACSKALNEAEGEGLDLFEPLLADLEQATKEHESHSPASHYTECHKCMAEFGRRTL